MECFDCVVCLEKWCVKDPNCEKPHKVHPGLSCKAVENDDSGLEIAIKDGTVKRCPKCKTSTIRYDGCNHMTCLICKAHFCWLCVKEFQIAAETYDHLTKIHGSFWGN